MGLETSSPLEALASLAYLTMQIHKLDAAGVEDIEGAEVTEFDDLPDDDKQAWISVVAAILGTNKLLLVPTPIELMAEHAKHAHDRAVMTNLSLPGTRVGPEWDAAVMAALRSAHLVVPKEVAKVKLCGDRFVSLDGRDVYLPERVKDGDKILVAFVPIEEDDSARHVPC